MAKTTQEFIEEIRSSARGRIDGAALETLIEEVRAHLDAGIQARLELGLSLDEAEEESVLTFGSAISFTDRMLDQRRTPPLRNAMALSLLVTIAVVAFVAESLSQHDNPIEIWTGLSLLVAIVVAGLQGWRHRINLRHLVFGAVLTVPAAALFLSAIYIVDPISKEIDQRSSVKEWSQNMNPPGWLQSQRDQLNDVVTQKRREFNSQQGPYKIPRSVDSADTPPFRWVVSRPEALQVLEQFRLKREHELITFAPTLQDNQRYMQDLLAIPIPVNAFRILPIAVERTGAIWLIVATAQILAAMFSNVLGRRVRSKLLASPILEIGLEEHDAVAASLDFQRLKRLDVKNNLWVDGGVSLSLLITLLATAAVLPKDFAGNFDYSLLFVCGGFIAWRSWSVKRPQFVPILASFFVGIPLYAVSFRLYASQSVWSHTGFDWGIGIGVSATMFILFGVVSILSWFVGSICRRLRNRSVRGLAE